MANEPKYQTVGQITATNTMRFRENTNGMTMAISLLASRTPGAPVVDDTGKFVGFLSEFDILRALEKGKDLNAIQAKDLMEIDRITVAPSTPIKDAVLLLEKNRLLNLPVVENGIVTMTVSRHDLLRAWLGLDVGMEF